MIQHEAELQTEVVLGYDIPVGSNYPDIWRNMADSARTIVSLHNALDVAQANHSDLEKESKIDKLTGVRNQDAFLEEFPATVSRANRNGENLVAAFIDLDNFKQVNDGVGHSTGDDLLRRAGQILSLIVRANDSVYRKGGDEFVIVMPNFGAERDYASDQLLDRVGRVGAKISTVLNEGIRDSKLAPGIPVGASVGICLLKSGEVADDFFDRLDASMKTQKALRKQI